MHTPRLLTILLFSQRVENRNGTAHACTSGAGAHVVTFGDNDIADNTRVIGAERLDENPRDFDRTRDEMP